MPTYKSTGASRSILFLRSCQSMAFPVFSLQIRSSSILTRWTIWNLEVVFGTPLQVDDIPPSRIRQNRVKFREYSIRTPHSQCTIDYLINNVLSPSKKILPLIGLNVDREVADTAYCIVMNKSVASILGLVSMCAPDPTRRCRNDGFTVAPLSLHRCLVLNFSNHKDNL